MTWKRPDAPKSVGITHEDWVMARINGTHNRIRDLALDSGWMITGPSESVSWIRSGSTVTIRLCAYDGQFTRTLPL